VWTKVPSGKVKEVAAMPKAIHAQEDRDAAREKARLVIEKLRTMKLCDAAELIEAGVEETLSYYAFPSEHWRSLRTNNPLERLNRVIRRRITAGKCIRGQAPPRSRRADRSTSNCASLPAC
jgi:putative transposase